MKLRYGIGYNWNKVRRAALSALKKLSFDGLLSGAWFHKKEPTYEVVDETPDVDTSRTWHKARALQFTGAEHIDIPLQLHYAQSTWKVEFEFIFEEHTSRQYIFDARVSPNIGVAMSIRAAGNVPDLLVYNGSSYANVSLSEGLVSGLRYKGYAEYDGTRNKLFIEGITDTAEEGNTFTQVDSNTTFRIGAYIGGGSNFIGSIGWMRITQDNIVTAEYAFEEGEGTVCYNRVMNNFHGTINNATISTFRVEDVRITNGDQGTFLNTDGYTNTFRFLADGTYGTIPIDTSSATNMSIRWKSLTDLSTPQLYFSSNQSDHWLGYYPSSATNFANETHLTLNGDVIVNGTIVANTGTAVRSQMVDDSINTFEVTGLDISTWSYLYINRYYSSGFNTRTNILSIEIDLDGDGVYEYEWDADLKAVKSHSDISITGSNYNNLLIPRPRVTDIPLYNAGKYAYYIPDHVNNYIDLNTAFAGLTNPGDWMEFGIATVGTGEPDSEGSTWALSIDGSDTSSFYARIGDTDFRFYGPANSYRMQRNVDLTNRDFYSFRVTKNYNTTQGITIPYPGTIEIFDRDGNLIHSAGLQTIGGNEGTHTFDRFFPQTYSTDFILAYLKLSDGTVWNGANDFNGGVNITNTGTGNVTKIFFESVDEDVLGNPLTYEGQVAQPLSLVNSNGALFSSGVRAEWNSSQIFDLDDFTMVWYAYLDEDLRGAGPNDWREAFTGLTSSTLFYFTTAGIYFRANGVNSANKLFLEGNIPEADFINKWQRFSFTRSASNNIATFTAGDVVRTVNLSETAGLSFDFKAFGDLGQEGLQGQLGWASVHSKLLTPSQVAVLDPYNMDTDSLEVFLVPSVGSDSTIYDLSGNNRHATVTGATLSNFWIKQDQFHWNLKKGFDYYTRFADDVNQVQYNEQLPALAEDQTYTIRTQFYFAGFPYPDTLGRGESMLFSAKINGTQRFAIWIEGNTNSATLNAGYYDGSTYHTVLLLSPMKPGPYYLEIVKDSSGYDFTSITLNGNNIDLNQAGATFTTIIYQVGISCRAVDTTADRRWYGGIKFFEIVGQHYLSEDNGFVDTIGNLTLDVANSNISTQKDRIPYAPPGKTLSNPAGKWHNDAETEINFPHTAKLQVINEQFDYKPFFYKNAQLDDATAAYSMRKVIADYEGPLLNVIRSSDLQAQDFYPDSRGDLDTTAITNFVNDASPVLDDYSGAAVAYSLRKVRSAYTGSAIEVRRSSNGDTLNIGFDANGDLDTTALENFCRTEHTIADEDFSSSTGWNLGTGVSITEGVLRANTSGTVTAYKNFGDTGAQQVRVTFTISNYVSGSVRYMNFAVSTTGTTRTANGTYTEVLTLKEGGNFNHGLQMFNTFVGDIDDFEIVQLTADGHVTTWYDQTQNDSLNQNNATQSDPVKMPLIVEAGDVVLEEGKPAIQFGGATAPNHLLNDDITLSSSDSTYVIVARHQGNGNVNFYDSGENVKFFLQFNNLGQNAVFDVDGTEGGIDLNYDNDSNSKERILSVINLGNGTLESSFNGVVTNNTSSVSVVTRNGLTLGGHRDRVGTNSLDGIYQEFIIFDSNQSTNRTGIEANIGRYYSIDGFADGRVATWYDQANANHATQATPDQQPLIVNDGVLVTENSKPAIDFDGMNDVLIKSGFNGNAIVAGSSFIISVSSYRPGAVDTFNTICHVGGIEDSQTSLITIGYNQVGNAIVSGKYLGTYLHKLGETSQINTQYLNTLDFDSSFDLYQNGVLATYNMNPSADVTANVLAIGGGGSGSNHFLAGNIQELIIYDSSQSNNRQDIEKNTADYYDITLSGNAGVESWVKNVSFADMYQSWYDYEYLHRLFANFEIPNKVFKVLAYTNELTADQRQQVYDYLQKNYHPIYTPYSTRVLADGGTLAAGQTNTLTIIDSI